MKFPFFYFIKANFMRFIFNNTRINIEDDWVAYSMPLQDLTLGSI